MHSFLFGFIVPFLLFISGCSSSQDDSVVENTKAPSILHQNKEFFAIQDIDGRTTKLRLNEHNMSIERVRQSTVLIHLFSTRAELCRAMLRDLSDLQHKHKKNLFLLGIAVPEVISREKLRIYMLDNHANFFISNNHDSAALAHALVNLLQLDSNYPLPLTILFHNGQIIRYYTGITPVEMIYNDIYTLNPELKKGK